MKNKKKKRGFTLIELLATITILSVVMIIAIPSVTKLIKKFGDNYYNMLEGNIKLAGMDYFTDHKTEIPKYINESSVISLNDLVTKGYIEETPKDKNKKEITEGYVIAYKTNKGKYEYQACIITKDREYETTADYCGDSYKLDNNVILVPPSNGVYSLPQKKPENFANIITPYAATKQYKTSNSIREMRNTQDTVVPTKAIVSCEKDCDEIATGEYQGENLKEKLNAIISNYFNGVNKDTYTSKLKEFLNKKIKIKYIYEYEGKKAETLFSIVEANEGEIPGEIQVELFKLTANAGGEVYGSVVNGAWSETSIPENTNLINWTNKVVRAKVSPINDNEKRITKYYCESKNNPGNIFECANDIKNSQTTIIYSQTNNLITVYGVNKFGTATKNKVTYSIKTDAVPPDVPTSKVNGKKVEVYNEAGNWTNQSITWSDFASEAYSGIERYEYLRTDDTIGTLNINGYTYPLNTDNGVTNSLYKIRAVSQSGNVSEWSDVYNFKIDKVIPPVPTSKVDNVDSTGGTYGWTNKDITWGNFSSRDSGSGIKKYEYINASGSVGTLSSSYNYPLNAAKTMDGTLKIRAVDKAGNVSKWSNEYTFKIDKIKPTCTSSGGSSSWTKENVTITGRCNDTNSGCKTASVTKTIDQNNNSSVSPGTVYDNAGNSVSCPKQSVKIDKTAPSIESYVNYNAGSCLSFRTEQNVVKHRLKLIFADNDGEIDSIYYKYSYEKDPGDSDSGWLDDNDNTLNLKRSNSILLDGYSRIRQDYNLLQTDTAYFRFKVCNKAGVCSTVSRIITASSVSDVYTNEKKYCRDIFNETGKSFLVADN